MNKDERLKLAFDSLLEVFDSFQVSAEDGAFLSWNLLLNALDFAKEQDSNMPNDLVTFRQKPSDNYSPFPPEKWGLDPSLLTEEN